MKFETEIYSDISKIQQSVQSMNESIGILIYYYSNLLSEVLKVKEKLKKINEDEYLSIDSSVEINDCVDSLNKACKKLI